MPFTNQIPLTKVSKKRRILWVGAYVCEHCFCCFVCSHVTTAKQLNGFSWSLRFGKINLLKFVCNNYVWDNNNSRLTLVSVLISKQSCLLRAKCLLGRQTSSWRVTENSEVNISGLIHLIYKFREQENSLASVWYTHTKSPCVRYQNCYYLLCMNHKYHKP